MALQANEDTNCTSPPKRIVAELKYFKQRGKYIVSSPLHTPDPQLGVQMAQQQQLRTTFGRLEGSSDKVVLPSTLSYRERTELAKKHGFEYGKIYNCSSSRGMSVYDRLTADASVRQTLKTMHSPPCTSQDPRDVKLTHASSSPPRSNIRPPSGFVSNNNIPALTRSLREAASSSGTAGHSPALLGLHPITVKSQYKSFPMEFLAATRPQAQTTNQTMRMLGTYASDAAVAKALNVHIPAGSVRAGFHPDVNC